MRTRRCASRRSGWPDEGPARRGARCGGLREAQPQGFPSAPTAHCFVTNQGDISNEVRKGTFLTRHDIGQKTGLRFGQEAANLISGLGRTWRRGAAAGCGVWRLPFPGVVNARVLCTPTARGCSCCSIADPAGGGNAIRAARLRAGRFAGKANIICRPLLRRGGR